MDTLSINGLGSMKTAQISNLKANSTAIKKYNCEDESCSPSFKGINLTKTGKSSRVATLAALLLLGFLTLIGCQKQPRPQINEYYIDPNDSTYLQFMDSIWHNAVDSIPWPWSGYGPF